MCTKCLVNKRQISEEDVSHMLKVMQSQSMLAEVVDTHTGAFEKALTGSKAYLYVHYTQEISEKTG